jgi:tetratricopeptide (TPR) repeat protein
MRKWMCAAVAGLALAGGSAWAQADKSEAETKAEDAQAQALFARQNYVAALPLYEELHRLQPQSTVYDERLAMSVLGGAPGQTEEQRADARKRAMGLLQQARAAGDNSNLLQVMMEKLQQAAAQPPAERPAGSEWFDQAEAAFGRGDLQGAVGLYAKALEVNPQYYAAATFAGDAEFKMGHPAEAGKWFAQAIAIDPDIETAHRYWGDSLEKAGEHARAEEEFIAAIVADPYSRSPRVGLKQWAEANHAMVVAPPIQLPRPATKGEDGKINITMSPDGSTEQTSLNLAYSMESALWQGDEFKKHFPQEKVYRHSLLEEATSIRMMLTVVKENRTPLDKLNKSTLLLMDLDRQGMLECWILLDDADQGIAQDYVAYRKEHRALMEQYIAKYDVHAM